MGTASIETAATATPSRTGKYLLFLLGAEEYGIPVLKVREIVGPQEPAPVPHTPAYVKGVINLRGKIIPITDLRLRFGLEAVETTDRTCIIVVNVEGAASEVLAGVVVDQVLEVADIGGDDIEDIPDFGQAVDVSYVLGIAKTERGVRILLNTDSMLALNGWQIDPAAAPAAG
jgi:purine-binding chemotaxis protein CheW